MDKNKRHEQIAHGAGRWQASRLKPVVKKRGTQKAKKPKGSHAGKLKTATKKKEKRA